MTTAVLCAVRGPLETLVVRALGAPGSPATVTRRCADLPELLAVAAAGLGTVAVVSADAADLDRDVVRELHESGVWVVAVADLRTGWSVERTRSLGVDRVVDASAVEREILRTVVELAGAAAEGARPGASVAGPPRALLTAGLSITGAAAAGEPVVAARSAGAAVAVERRSSRSSSARSVMSRWAAQTLRSGRGPSAVPADAATARRRRPGVPVPAARTSVHTPPVRGRQTAAKVTGRTWP